MTDFNYGYLSPFLQMQYQQYLPNVFDDSLSLYEQVKRLEGYLNNTLIAFNDSTSKISVDMQTFSGLITAVRDDVTGFKEQLENEVLPENLISILETWLANGQLATILTTELLGNKANKSDFDLLVTQVGEIDTDMVALGTELNEDLTTGLASIQTNVDESINRMAVPATQYFTVAEKADILLAVPLLDHSASIQAYVDAQKNAGNYNLYFPKGQYRFKNVNLYGDPWNVYGQPSNDGYIHETSFNIINVLNAVGFNSTARNISFKDLGLVSTGTRTDGLNIGFYKNPLVAGQFISVKNMYIVNFSGIVFSTLDLIDTTFENIRSDDSNTVLKAHASGWDRSTTVTLKKWYAIRGDKILDMPKTAQSRMVDCIFENNLLVGDISNGQWTLDNCYFENNTAGLLATDTQLVKGYCYHNTVADYPSNEQPTLDQYHWGESEQYPGGAHFSRLSTHYTVSGNLTENNTGNEQWNLLGDWYPQGGGTRLKMEFLGASGFNQATVGDGLLGNTGKTVLYATFTGAGNPSLPALTAYAYHEGSSKPIVKIKLVAKDQNLNSFNVFVLMSAYTSKVGFTLETTTGYFRKKLQTGVIDPGSANANLVDVPFEFKISTGTGSFEITPDGGMKFGAPTVVGGTAPATIDQYMWVQINGTYYKIPLYL